MVKPKPLPSNNKQSGFTHRLLFFGFILVIATLAFFRVSESKAAAASSAIKSGVSGYCVDDYLDSWKAGNKVVLWNCNDSAAQSWSVNGFKISHRSDCLSIQTDSQISGSLVVADSCNDSPGQIWLRDGGGYFNPNSDMCLTAPRPRQQLIALPCSSPTESTQMWIVSSGRNNQEWSTACRGTEGQVVACYAEQAWTTWQSGSVSHTGLLNIYTDGAPYEAWCADFVSYVYKEAGHPFTQAYDGWDESNANNIQNYGFTVHFATSGYIPKPGDIAYFDYNGGHVEIVVSGGKVPTFIYGNSATIDPTTGNGQMKANTITSDGAEGKLIYYLSPN